MTFALWFYAARASTFVRAITLAVHLATKNALIAGLKRVTPLYAAAVRLFDTNIPVVAAVQGAAGGGGFGLAVMPDFRVVCPEARFTANFVKLGFHPGFGLTHTLARLIGRQKAHLLFLTGRRITGENA